MQWIGLPTTESTSEDIYLLQSQYPYLDLEDKVTLEDGGSVIYPCTIRCKSQDVGHVTGVIEDQANDGYVDCGTPKVITESTEGMVTKRRRREKKQDRLRRDFILTDWHHIKGKWKVTGKGEKRKEEEAQPIEEGLGRQSHQNSGY